MGSRLIFAIPFIVGIAILEELREIANIMADPLSHSPVCQQRQVLQLGHVCRRAPSQQRGFWRCTHRPSRCRSAHRRRPRPCVEPSTTFLTLAGAIVQVGASKVRAGDRWRYSETIIPSLDGDAVRCLDHINVHDAIPSVTCCPRLANRLRSAGALSSDRSEAKC